MRIAEFDDKAIKASNSNIKIVIKESEVKSISNDILYKTVESHKGKFIDRRV